MAEEVEGAVGGPRADKCATMLVGSGALWCVLLWDAVTLLRVPLAARSLALLAPWFAIMSVPRLRLGIGGATDGEET
jgi:hypothetical protein